MSNEMTVEQLIAAWDIQEEKRKRRKFVFAGLALGSLALSCLIPLVAWLGDMLHWWGAMPQGWQGVFAVMRAISIIALISDGLLIAYSDRSLIGNLAGIEDVRAIGIMVDALQLPTTKHHARLVARLTQLLPQIKASDTGLLNQEQKRALSQTLGQRLDATFRNEQLYRLAVLKALEQIGGGEAVSSVAHVIEAHENSGPVKAAARACLPILRNRAESEKTSLTLLRPATADADVNQLLKPAAATETDTEQLLRPSP